jgi:hypothetical protein
MTIRQNNWAVGVHCQAYCRILTGHHTLEDRGIFPHFGRNDPELAAVPERLEEERELIEPLARFGYSCGPSPLGRRPSANVS